LYQRQIAALMAPSGPLSRKASFGHRHVANAATSCICQTLQAINLKNELIGGGGKYKGMLIYSFVNMIRQPAKDYKYG